ncbi:MAG: hypothetical protein K6A80_10510 [Saccharofermentans sp.]|nr:hypothetical protein [Saccharofermentans sp.]
MLRNNILIAKTSSVSNTLCDIASIGRYNALVITHSVITGNNIKTIHPLVFILDRFDPLRLMLIKVMIRTYMI